MTLEKPRTTPAFLRTSETRFCVEPGTSVSEITSLQEISGCGISQIEQQITTFWALKFPTKESIEAFQQSICHYLRVHFFLFQVN